MAWIWTEVRSFQANAAVELAKQASLPTEARGLVVGRLEIPRLGLSVMVVEGTSESNLRHAAGRISSTALPGQPGGNVGIAGHRDSFFRPLRKVRTGDSITLSTAASSYHYRVVATTVVRPTDVAVLDPTGVEMLTLVTCYPFSYIGAAPNRFIVHANRIP